MSAILVIEDDPSVAEGVADNLRFESHAVIVADSGEAGLRSLRRQLIEIG